MKRGHHVTADHWSPLDTATSRSITCEHSLLVYISAKYESFRAVPLVLPRCARAFMIKLYPVWYPFSLGRRGPPPSIARRRALARSVDRAVDHAQRLLYFIKLSKIIVAGFIVIHDCIKYMRVHIYNRRCGGIPSRARPHV